MARERSRSPDGIAHSLSRRSSSAARPRTDCSIVPPSAMLMASYNNGMRMLSVLPRVTERTRERVAREFDDLGPDVCMNSIMRDLQRHNPELLDMASKWANGSIRSAARASRMTPSTGSKPPIPSSSRWRMALPRRARIMLASCRASPCFTRLTSLPSGERADHADLPVNKEARISPG
jgi:hypothetical protein